VPPGTTTTSPAARPKPIYLLADHPLLAAGVALPDANCALPKFRRDTASLNAYYAAFVGCMNTTWQPVLAAGDMPYRAPKLNLAEHPGSTGCGNPDTDPGLGEFTAMYCPADETLYLPVDRLTKVDRGRSSSHLAVVAHEYSHHIQQLSGLLWAAAEATDKVGDDTPAGNELTRRTELQANCFAGLFLAAAAGRGGVSRTLAGQSVTEFRNGALPQTHGSAAHQASWAKKGYDQRTTAACNTWAAPASEVS
jgi:predicted metalloprotease